MSDNLSLSNLKKRAFNMEWINVKDRLPEPEVEIIIYDNKMHIVTGYRYSLFDEPDLWISTGEFTLYDVTHWMSLPKSPHEGQ